MNQNIAKEEIKTQENDEQESLGQKILQWREKAGLSRKDFARKLKVSLTAVKNWETGHSTPKLTKYSEIAKVLCVDIKDIGLDSNLDLDRIGDRIKYARLLRGLSIESFSYEFGFAIQTVKSWESHTIEVDTSSLGRISKALGVPETFFDTKNDPFQEISEAL